MYRADYIARSKTDDYYVRVLLQQLLTGFPDRYVMKIIQTFEFGQKKYIEITQEPVGLGLMQRAIRVAILLRDTFEKEGVPIKKNELYIIQVGILYFFVSDCANNRWIDKILMDIIEKLGHGVYAMMLDITMRRTNPEWEYRNLQVTVAKIKLKETKMIQTAAIIVLCNELYENSIKKGWDTENQGFFTWAFVFAYEMRDASVYLDNKMAEFEERVFLPSENGQKIIHVPDISKKRFFAFNYMQSCADKESQHESERFSKMLYWKQFVYSLGGIYVPFELD